MNLVTYFLLILQVHGLEPTVVLHFEDLEICQLAAQDLLGYESPRQCIGHITTPVLKMQPPTG